jgi:hypothetical protein
MATVALAQFDLNNKIVTADALHMVNATANHIHEHGGEFVTRRAGKRRLPCEPTGAKCSG